MRIPTRLFRIVTVVTCLAAASAAFAQFGHPLKGSWSGNWIENGARQHVVLNLNWDGKAISGAINPGPDAVPLTVATLDPSTWTVHLEGNGKDKNGAAVRYVIDGKIENLGAQQRIITGTWAEGSQKGTFKVTRN